MKWKIVFRMEKFSYLKYEKIYLQISYNRHCPMVALINEKNNMSQIFGCLHHFLKTNNFSYGGLPKTNVLFCKSSLSKMASVKTNKNKKWTPLPKTNF